MTVTLYAHRLSQPSRAVEILLRELAVPYEWREVDFANGQTRQPWFADRINPLGAIPALSISDGDNGDRLAGFALGESHAIMRYLCRTAPTQEATAQWYPGDRDALSTARIDLWLAWHHGNLRRYDMFHYIMNLHLTLPMLKREIQETLLKPLQDGLNRGLATLEAHFERRETNQEAQPTLGGGTHPTLADLAMTCELYQIVAVGYRFDHYPRVARWVDSLAQRTHFRDVSDEIMAQGRTIRGESGGYLDLDHAFA